MKRYSNTPIMERWDGKRVYKTTSYPTIPARPDDLQVVSSDGDYLDTLANKYYNDPTLYWIIAIANNLGKGRLSIPPGTNLRIPINVNRIINEFNSLNNQ